MSEKYLVVEKAGNFSELVERCDRGCYHVRATGSLSDLRMLARALNASGSASPS